MNKVYLLSEEFSRLVRRDAGSADVLATIVRMNKTIHPSCCATADHWDSNETMLEAWENVINAEMDANSGEDVMLWNAAWNRSKARGFKAEECGQ